MTNHVKVVTNGYILAIGLNIENGVLITQKEYDTILTAIRNKPAPTATTDYQLREDLTWVAYEVEPPEPEPESINEAEALAIILGGAI